MKEIRMSPADEKELRRLTEMIAEVDKLLPDPSPLREGLQKAALALHRAFIEGSRCDIEKQYGGIGAPLSDEQVNNLRMMGLDR